MTVDEIRRARERVRYSLMEYDDVLIGYFETLRAEIQRLEARIAVLTAAKEPSQEAIEWAREEIKRTGQKPPMGLMMSKGASAGEEV